MGAKQGKAPDRGSVAVPLRALPVGGPLGTWGNLWEAPGGPADLQIPIGPGPRATYAPRASKFTYGYEKHENLTQHAAHCSSL